MDEENQSEVEMTEPTQQPEQTQAEMVSISAAELESIRAALKKANGEAAKYRKTAEQAEAERKAKEEAEMTELDKAKKRAAELEAELKSERHTRLQETAAEKAGLPKVLADRLKGETLEELEADAKAILETLPKPAAQTQQPKSPGIIPANPGSNGTTGETDAARRARLGF